VLVVVPLVAESAIFSVMLARPPSGRLLRWRRTSQDAMTSGLLPLRFDGHARCSGRVAVKRTLADLMMPSSHHADRDL
jgi:hypothetical protein